MAKKVKKEAKPDLRAMKQAMLKRKKSAEDEAEIVVVAAPPKQS